MPQQMYDMTLWEFNACVHAYNDMLRNKGKEQIAICWQTANMTGSAFAGKLRPLKHYLKFNEEKKVSAPKVSREEFEARLKLAEEGGCKGVIERT